MAEPNDTSKPNPGSDGSDRVPDRRPPFLDGNDPTLAVGLGPNGPYAHRHGRLILWFGRGSSDEETGPLIVEANRVIQRFLADHDLGDIVYRPPGDDADIERKGYAAYEFDDSRVNIPQLVEALKEQQLPASVDLIYSIDSFTAAPMHLNSALLSNPMHLNGLFYSPPMYFDGVLVSDPMHLNRRSSARPYESPPALLDRPLDIGACPPLVVVVDTGFPKGTAGPDAWEPPSQDIVEIPDIDGDRILDPAAGHNGFIQGIVHRGAAMAQLHGLGVITNDGIGCDTEIGDALLDLHDHWTKKKTDFGTAILNLSFSGYFPDDTPPPVISDRVRLFSELGTVVVASAGNDGTCRPAFPAAMCEVIGVGSVGPCGPSWFSNHGPWVNASAPGEDVVSDFFKWNGGFTSPPGTLLPDPDHFKGSAMWSGTSFAAPRVVAAIARQIQLRSCTALEAVELVLGRPGLFRLPDYGVIVNQGF